MILAIAIIITAVALMLFGYAIGAAAAGAEFTRSIDHHDHEDQQ